MPRTGLGYYNRERRDRDATAAQGVDLCLARVGENGVLQVAQPGQPKFQVALFGSLEQFLDIGGKLIRVPGHRYLARFIAHGARVLYHGALAHEQDAS